MNDRIRPPAAGWCPRSLAIGASAGYGKTEILALRILALLLSGCAPGEFIAMTFSRAAAAEIYSRLLLMVSKALSTEAMFRDLRERLKRECRTDAFDAVSPDDLRDLLAVLVREMPRLRISTFDSFFMTIVRCFPLELGLPGDANLISEESYEVMCTELLRRLSADAETGGDFGSLCREMMFGEEKKRLRAICSEMISMLEPFHSRRNDLEAWGGKWLELSVTPKEELERALQRCSDYGGWPESYTNRVAPMLKRCTQANDPETRFTRDEVEVLRAFLAVYDQFPGQKPAGFAAGWDYPLPQAEAIKILIRQGGRLLLHQAARRTAALRRWYCRWCALYAKEMWRRGRLQFADLAKLLHDDDPFGRGDGSGEEWLREIEYRMNSRFRHFLLDEFQDTSRTQWAVLEPMTASDDEHSLFLVGDVKQAIYGWRAGDSRLIGEVADGMEQQSLKFSYRYGAEICEAINRIFGEIIPKSFLIPETVRERWSDPRCFQPHAAAGERPGRFTVLALMPEPKVKAEEGEPAAEVPQLNYAEAAARLILARLRELDFPAKPLQCGVLCRSGKEGVEIRDQLIQMEPGLANRIIWDGNEQVADDPLVNALLAMLIAIRHPAETAALEMVRMYPHFAELLPQDPEEYAAAGALLDEGISPMLRDLCRRIRQLRKDMPEECAPIPSENPANLEILLAAAAEFDAAGTRGSVRDFCNMMRKRKRSGIPQEGTLRMLTVHHSKGLTLDVVFYPLPQTQKNTLNLHKPDYGGMLTGSDRSDVSGWLLFGVRAAEGALDPELRRAAELSLADRIFEEICVLYVALTRARCETVLIIPPLSAKKLAVIHPDYKKTKSFRPKTILELPKEPWYLNDVIFEGLFAERCLSGPRIPRSEGMRVLERRWGGDWPLPAANAAPTLPPLAPPPPEPNRPAPRRVTPSRTAGAKSTPHLFFTLPAGDEEGADFGTRVHECFAAIDRLETAVLPADPKLAAEIRRCRNTPAVLAVIDETADEVWKERPFDVLLDDPESPGVGMQLTGCFDRVHIRRDAAGRALRARIIDYKSNRGGSVEELTCRYAGQMACYRAALAKLLALDAEEIRCTLIFTRSAAVVDVPEETLKTALVNTAADDETTGSDGENDAQLLL